jgi:rRNA processing protein Gar1
LNGSYRAAPLAKRISQPNAVLNPTRRFRREKAVNIRTQNCDEIGRVNSAFGRVNPAFGRVNPAFGRVNPAFGRVNPAAGVFKLLLSKGKL